MEIIYYIFAMLSVLLTGIGQTFLKVGVRNRRALGVYFNPATVIGYIIFVLVTISSVFALQGLELKLFYALTSLNYVVVIGLSRIVLKEKVGRDKLRAICMIIFGVILFNI